MEISAGGELLAYCLIMLSVLFSSISNWVGRKKEQAKQTGDYGVLSKIDLDIKNLQDFIHKIYIKFMQISYEKYRYGDCNGTYIRYYY